MLFLIMIAEIAALFALGFYLAAWAQGTPRMRDWSLTSLYPRRDRNSDEHDLSAFASGGDS